MFAGLKNKIKEETGSDPTKLVSPAQKVVTPTNRGRHSRQGSGSSVGSISLDGAREELVSSPTHLKRQDSSELKLPDGKVVGSKDAKRLERREDEWRRRLAQRDDEWGRRLDKKEEEFQKQLQEQKEEWKTTLEVLEREKSVLEEEKLEIVKQKLALEEALRASDEYKKKVFQYQEDLDQLEGFQTQEMAKIKHLLLVKEQEVAERVNTLKESSSQIEQLKSEVNRLRRYEEEYSNLQASVTQERNQYNTRLEELDAECAQITVALEAERSACASFRSENSRLERELESERTRANNLVQDLERECGEKDATLVRNAQVNQQVELARQELRAQQGEVSDLNQRMHALQSQLDERQNELERIRKEREELATRVGVLQVIEHDKEAASAVEGRLRASLVDMEEQLTEKHKHIRVLQQRLGDMKKTLQRELRAGGDSGDYEAGVAILTPSSSKTITNNHNSGNTGISEDDVNFKYLKHVLIKFLTSREYEAQHLTRAVATLLRFSPEEERLLRETLDWKMSWFGSRPRLGAGQTAKAIPPS